MTSRHARSSARPSKVPPIAQLAEFLLSSLICIPFSLGSHLEAINFKQFPQWTQEQKTVTFDSEGSTQFENGRNMTTDQSITSWVVTDDGSVEKSVPIGLNYSFRVVRRSSFVDSQVRVWDQGTATYIWATARFENYVEHEDLLQKSVYVVCLLQESIYVRFMHQKKDHGKDSDT